MDLGKLDTEHIQKQDCQKMQLQEQITAIWSHVKDTKRVGSKHVVENPVGCELQAVTLDPFIVEQFQLGLALIELFMVSLKCINNQRKLALVYYLLNIMATELFAHSTSDTDTHTHKRTFHNKNKPAEETGLFTNN